MCGIAGKVSCGAPSIRPCSSACAPRSSIAAPTRAGRSSTTASGSASSGCAIIDLETGDQPIHNEEVGRRRPERRDLQLPRAAGGAQAPRAPVLDPLGHRGDRPPLRGARRRLRRATCAGCSRSPVGPAPAAAAARPRPDREEAALLRPSGWRALVRLGGEGDPPGPRRSRAT